jgi:hypothetical protein
MQQHADANATQGRVSNNPRASAAQLVALLLLKQLYVLPRPNLNRLKSGV